MSMMRVTRVLADPYASGSPSPHAYGHESAPAKEKAEEYDPAGAVFHLVDESQIPGHPLERDVLSLASLSEGEEKERYIAALKDWMGSVLKHFGIPEERTGEILQNEKHLDSFFYISQHGIHFISPMFIDGYNQRALAWRAAVNVLELPVDTLDPFYSIPRELINFSKDQTQVINLLRSAFNVKIKHD